VRRHARACSPQELIAAIEAMRRRNANTDEVVHGWRLIYTLRDRHSSTRGDMTAIDPIDGQKIFSLVGQHAGRPIAQAPPDGSSPAATSARRRPVAPRAPLYSTRTALRRSGVAHPHPTALVGSRRSLCSSAGVKRKIDSEEDVWEEAVRKAKDAAIDDGGARKRRTGLDLDQLAAVDRGKRARTVVNYAEAHNATGVSGMCVQSRIGTAQQPLPRPCHRDRDRHQTLPLPPRLSPPPLPTSGSACLGWRACADA
jgi:hypothetical protein